MFENYVGIDIGSQIIKLSYQNKIYEIDTPDGTIENGEILSISKLGEAIKPLVMEHKLQKKATVIVYNGPSVFTKVVKIPNMSEKEIKKYLEFEAESIIPFSLKEGIMDYIVLDIEKTTMDILVLAIKSEQVSPILKAVTQGGLQPVAIDVPGLALSRTLFKEDKKNKEAYKGLQFVVDIGRTTTDIHIYQDSIFRFSRTISIGGEDFDRMLAIATGVDRKKAMMERLSSKHDPMIFRAIFSDLQRELVRSINYFRHRFGNQDDKFEQVFVVGGNSSMPGLDHVIEEIVEVKPSPVDDSKYLLVKGLSDWKQSTCVNLLPLEFRPEPKFQLKRFAVGLAIGIVIVYTITNFVAIHMDISRTNKTINTTKSNIGSLERTLEINKEHKEQLQKIKDLVLSIESVQTNSISYGEVLEELGKHTPRSIQLTSLAMTGEQLSIQAQAPDLTTLALFMDSLNAWENYENFFLSQTSLSNGRYVFSIQGHRKRGVQ